MMTLAFIGGLGTAEVLFILLIIMLLFGAAKIPDLARSLGKAQKEFQSARDEIEREINTPPKKTADAPAASGSSSPPAEASNDRLVAEANELGIATEGKTPEQLRQEIDASEAAHTPKE